MGNELTGSSTKRLKPSESAYVRVRLAPSHAFDTRRDDRLPARGVVILRVREKDNEAAAPTVKVRDLIVPQIQPSLAEHDVTRAGLAAAIVVLLVGMVASRRARPNPAIGGTPKWTPQSWSTNLAIGGALLTACTSRSADCQPRVTTPRRRRIRHSPAFFAALVALAPAVYGLLRVGSVSPATALRLFALSSAVTVWATVGATAGRLHSSRWSSASRACSLTQRPWPPQYIFWTVAVLVVLYASRAVLAYGKGSTPTVVTGGGGHPVPPPERSRRVAAPVIRRPPTWRSSRVMSRYPRLFDA